MPPERTGRAYPRNLFAAGCCQPLGPSVSGPVPPRGTLNCAIRADRDDEGAFRVKSYPGLPHIWSVNASHRTAALDKSTGQWLSAFSALGSATKNHSHRADQGQNILVLPR